MAAVASLTARRAAKAARPELESYYARCASRTNEWIRKQVLQNNRIDILATILGLEVQPFHLSMMRFQFMHPQSLQLVFRGAGKTTTCTVTKAIHWLLKNPNLRIVIVSKTAGHAKDILREIKGHFETNVRLQEIFGAYHDPRSGKKWDETQIEVLPRTITAKEPSVLAIGVGGQIVGKHFDCGLLDDIVDEINSRTELQREKVKSWYYQSFDPTIDPPDVRVEHRGEVHHLGTRYHFVDMWGHLIASELKDHHQIIRALDEKGRSPWPSRFTPRFFLEKRKKTGLIIFNAQYQNDTEAMKGEIFKYDYMQKVDIMPNSGLRVFMGVDLAISQNESADKFAIVVLGVAAKRSAYYVLDYFEGQLRFSEQTEKIIEFAQRWDPIRIAIETNQYQESQVHTLQDREEDDEDVPDLRLKSLKTDRDKVTRAWKISPLFEEMKVFFRPSHDLLIEHLVLFPSGRYKDLFDAFDLAYRASRQKRRRSRRQEPGII